MILLKRLHLNGPRLLSKIRGMDWELVLETFTSRDAGAEPTWMYAWRVSNTSPQFMPLLVNGSNGLTYLNIYTSPAHAL